MCGLAGHVVPSGERPDVSAVRVATQRLAHRGPDGDGIAQYETACLGHRRLSIIDIAGSPQPWVSEDRRYTLVFNGEIYNYVELRAELAAEGVRFRSNGDTEVLLAMYIRHGARCLDKLNGMFAFAVWDNVARSLFLARDRVGKKPLFYALLDRGLAFSSEFESLLAFTSIERRIDPQAVRDFFAYQFIPAPRTIYRAVRKLPAGHYLRYDDGRVRVDRYWTPPRPAAEDATSDDARCEELRDLLQDAVRLRLRSDVPLGAFLSGGIDSSIIVGLMRRLGVTANTFHVGFEQGSYDESGYAEIAAKYFGTNHRSQTLPVDYLDTLDASLAHFGEPFADASAIPTWHLCRYTRQAVTVALSGDGADELFGGYRRYYARQFVGHYLRLPAALRKPLAAALLRWLPEGDDYYASSAAKKLRLFLQLAERTAAAPNDLLAQTFSPEELRLLLRNGAAESATNHVGDFHLEALDGVSKMIFTDTLVYLPDDILVKVDRMSMAHALEVRNPFLDHRVVEFACRLPLSLKLHRGTQKRILRMALRDLLPASIWKREKHGFAVPLGRSFNTTLARAFEETVLDAPVTDIVNREVILSLWRSHRGGRVDHGFKLWSLLVFHRWYHRCFAPAARTRVQTIDT